jgi:hypothetical protein
VHTDAVDLSKFTSLEDAAAVPLAKHQGDLDLSGLKSLSSLAARDLRQHCGPLVLSGLKKLRDEVAQALSEHEGFLDLSGLEILSDIAAQYLSKHKSPLDLSGLAKLSSRAAACLAKNSDAVFPFVLRPEAAEGALELDGELHSAERPAIRSKKLQAIQIVLPVSSRPLHRIREEPEQFAQLKSHIVELQHQSETALDRTALARLYSWLESSPMTCASFHFTLPKSVADLVYSGDWNETCRNLEVWAKQELHALHSCFVDVENLTERCNACVSFTKKVFRNRRYVKEDEIEDETMSVTSLQWRCIGNEIAVTMIDQTDQYEVPPHELSDLFNRALPPERTMVYLDLNNGANGLYVLMETDGMESRLSKVLTGQAP